MSSPSARPPGLVLVLWDAGAAGLAERFLDEGALPNLARLASRGFRAAARPSWPCAQTPPGMATLVTGTTTDRHGIHGYREAARPRELHPVTETASGFDARRLAAEPLWTTASRAGRAVALLHAPLGSPAAAYARGGPWGPRDGRDGEILTFDGYGSQLATAQVLRATELLPLPAAPPPPAGEIPLEETRGFAIPLPDLEGEAPGGEAPALVLGIGRPPGGEGFTRAWLRPGSEPPFPLPPGAPVPFLLSPVTGTALTLLELDPAGRDLLLWRGGIWRLRASRDGAAEALARSAGPFLGAGAGVAYREGDLGPTCRDSGAGVAERRFLAALEASSSLFARASRHVLREHRSPFTVLYEPCIDEAAHLVQDLATRALAGSGGEAARGLDVLREAYRLADRHLGVVLDEVGDGVTVAVASDHGQQGIHSVFRPNAVLVEAGLAALDATGRFDLARTRVVYGLGGNGYLLVNDADRPHGIVPRGEVETVAREAAALLRARRGADGTPLLLDVLWPGQKGERGAVPGGDAGDAYLLAARGVTLWTSPVGAALEPGHGGQHTAALDDRELDALLVVGGPRVPRLGRLEAPVDNADVAPTLARLVNLPAPRHATGRALV